VARFVASRAVPGSIPFGESVVRLVFCEEPRMASEENRRELEEKVEALVKSRFGGDYRTAFGHYDADSKDEMKALLSDAGIGRGLTRWAWAKGVIGGARHGL